MIVSVPLLPLMTLLLPRSAIAISVPLIVTVAMSSRPSGSDKVKMPDAVVVVGPTPEPSGDRPASYTTSFGSSTPGVCGSGSGTTVGGSFLPLMAMFRFAVAVSPSPSVMV